MRKTLMALLGMALFAWLAAPAAADLWHIDSFFDVIDSGGQVLPPPQSGGTGFDGNGDGQGDWVYYPNTGWANQWFYDDPLDMNRWKEIYYDIQIDPTSPNGQATVVINWSSPLWPDGTGAPPLAEIEDPPGSGTFREITIFEEEEWIVRDVYLYDDIVPVGGIQLTNMGGNPIVVPYNPEWVSIDVMGIDVTMIGVIEHACIPEPATIALLGLASLVLLCRRWTR